MTVGSSLVEDPGWRWMDCDRTTGKVTEVQSATSAALTPEVRRARVWARWFV